MRRLRSGWTLGQGSQLRKYAKVKQNHHFRVIFPLCFLVFNLLYWTLVADNDIFDFIVGEEHEQ